MRVKWTILNAPNLRQKIKDLRLIKYKVTNLLLTPSNL